LQDYAAILKVAEAEADLVLWDGGNSVVLLLLLLLLVWLLVLNTALVAGECRTMLQF
jgi:hypothetical protein